MLLDAHKRPSSTIKGASCHNNQSCVYNEVVYSFQILLTHLVFNRALEYEAGHPGTYRSMAVQHVASGDSKEGLRHHKAFRKGLPFLFSPLPPKAAMLIHLNPVSGYKKEYNFGKFEKNHWYPSNERFLL
jgi:hypothetical protein